MLLAYLDESYTRDFYLIAALLVPASEANSLTRALDDVVTNAMWDYGGVHSSAELHGYDIVAAKGDWVRLAPKMRARIAVYNKALQAVAAHDVKVVIRSVDVLGLRKRYASPDPPHSIALAHLIERVDECAESLGELALMIADEVHGQDGYRRDLWRYQRSSTLGYRSRRITRIVDTIHFAPSASSRLVQAADLVAYLARRRATMSRPTCERRAPTRCCGLGSSHGSGTTGAGSRRRTHKGPRRSEGLGLTGVFS